MLYFARYNLFGASQIPKREGTISYAHGTHATRLKGIRMIVVAPERRSLPRSTHPQSRRRQVARVEVGGRRRKKRDTQNLPPPPLSLSQFQLTPNRKRSRRLSAELAAFQTLNEYTMGSWLQKRYQTRMDATE